MSNAMLEEAYEIFGEQIVDDVLMTTEFGDIDGVWAMFNDMGYEDHVACLEFLFYEQ